MLDNADAALARGIGGIKIKVGQSDTTADLRRVQAVREHLGADTALMVDANQQWDRATAQRFGRTLEQFRLTWIEEPLDAHDAEGHAALAASLDTPVATGERAAGAERGPDARTGPAGSGPVAERPGRGLDRGPVRVLGDRP
ncbi:enolase C-terminal domain-like protein [Streptomyces lydicus]|uniref:enolase C-terminal domain-like protein n=1 Tax=Streptomyces lydicus TaxID=47763 RepID=UPI003799FB60